MKNSCANLAEAGRDHLSECQVAVTVGSLLAADISRDLQDTILDLLATLAESGMSSYFIFHSVWTDGMKSGFSQTQAVSLKKGSLFLRGQVLF